MRSGKRIKSEGEDLLSPGVGNSPGDDYIYDRGIIGRNGRSDELARLGDDP